MLASKLPKILISGGGIAGLTSAFWLRTHGFPVTVVERAPHCRTEGWVIDFWGPGYDVAEKMDLLDELSQHQFDIDEISFVNEQNKRQVGTPLSYIIDACQGRYISLLRSQLARSLYEKNEKSSHPTWRFDDNIQSLNETNDGVDVTFQSGDQQSFDIIIAADGLHSQLAKDFPSRREHYLGYQTCSFTVDNNFLNQDALDKRFLSFASPKKQVAIYPAQSKNRLTTFWLWQDADPLSSCISSQQQKNYLREKFRNEKWFIPQLLEQIDTTNDWYFDRVSQIHTDPNQADSTWSQGRIVAVGDAAYCLSLVSGQGSSYAMAGAYLLAEQLKKAYGLEKSETHLPPYTQAFQTYQQILSPFIISKQQQAMKTASWFVPSSQFGIQARNMMMKISTLPFIAKYAFKSMIGNDLNLR